MTTDALATRWLLLPSVVLAIDNGLGLRPPLGWRNFNAFYNPSQVVMEDTMDAMVSRSRLVDGKPTSLLDLGYVHVGLDGGWNYCFKENHTFHLADGTPVWNERFPDPQGMVDKAHALGLSPGWYLNNCGCAENHISDPALVETIMAGSVKALARFGFDGVKFDSCSQFHNLTHWAELLNATGRPVLIENCHQGGYAPGMRQWQAYLRNGTSGEYTHGLGYFVVGSDEEPPLANVTADACLAECSRRAGACVGICFESDTPWPAAPLGKCYVKGTGARFHSMDLSDSNHCAGTTSPSDCPYNFFRTSGDIRPHWAAVLNNLQSTRPFLEGDKPLSRPGAFAYPDMLEVGNLANSTESRSHFALWAVMSSPLSTPPRFELAAWAAAANVPL